MQAVLPRHLRAKREKIFGDAPSHRLDGNAKARVWATATAYNSANRVDRQHQGSLTWASLRVLRVLLWRFHNADGASRCFPSYEKIAAAAKCHRDSVCVALKALEDAGILTWVHRLTRIRRREQDLFGHWGSIWQVIRTSNAYQFLNPLDREPGRRSWCKSENPSRPQNQEKKNNGARLDGAQVMQEETFGDGMASFGTVSGSKTRKSLNRPPPVRAEPPAIALQREQAAWTEPDCSTAERAAL